MQDGLIAYLTAGLLLIGGYSIYLYFKVRLLEILLIGLTLLGAAINVLFLLIPNVPFVDKALIVLITYLDVITLISAVWLITGKKIPKPIYVTSILLTFMLLGLSLESPISSLFPVFSARIEYLKYTLTIFAVFGLVAFITAKPEIRDERVNQAQGLWITLFSLYTIALMGGIIYPSELWLIPVGLTIPFLGYIIGYAPEGLILTKSRLIKLVTLYKKISSENKASHLPINFEEYIQRVELLMKIEN